MATELSTLMHNQLGEPLAHFLSTQGENLAASERAVTVALPTIVLTILKYMNGNRDQAIALYNQVMGSNPQPYHDLITQLNKIPFNKITEIGKPLVTQLLGSNAQPTAAQIAHSSGVSNSGAYQLLNVALPLVLSLLRSRGWTAQEFYTILGSQSCWLNKTLSANLLSLLDIGSQAAECQCIGLSKWFNGHHRRTCVRCSRVKWLDKIIGIFVVRRGECVWFTHLHESGNLTHRTTTHRSKSLSRNNKRALNQMTYPPLPAMLLVCIMRWLPANPLPRVNPKSSVNPSPQVNLKSSASLLRQASLWLSATAQTPAHRQPMKAVLLQKMA